MYLGTNIGLEVAITPGDLEAVLVTVDERNLYSFEIEFPEPDREYGLWVGDIAAELAPGAKARREESSVGVARGRFVTWEEALHFEGARGKVWLRIASRIKSLTEARADLTWTPLFSIPVYVMAGKISNARYETMREELRKLAAGLLFDLISKSGRSLAYGFEVSGISVVSSQIELRRLERLWERLSVVLYDIRENPSLRLSIKHEYRQSWGSERYSAHTLARLAASGIDPRNSRVDRPFYAWQERHCESHNTLEHSVIKGFLKLLISRVQECISNIRVHISAIEQDRPLRERIQTGAFSLFQSEDQPRIEKLTNALDRGLALQIQLNKSLVLPFLRGVQASYSFESSPTFRFVRQYHEFFSLMRRYLQMSLIVIDEGEEERLKSTSRMYEQWVFFQLAAAFRAIGLRCESRDGFLQETKRYRYTLDVDRGARLTFEASEGYAISLRYEPWILPRELARQRRDTVFREGSGYAWSPDILIEVFAPNNGKISDEVSYAVVIDAKYSTHIRDHHWEATRKYQLLRSTHSNKQVARQLWLVAPLETDEFGIHLEDSSVTWTSYGPDCNVDEFIHGWIALLPGALPSSQLDEGWIAEPAEVLVEFAQGLLAFIKKSIF